MKNLNWKKEGIIWFALIAPFIYALIVWSRLPATVPTHFDLQGQPDDFSDSPFALLLLPAMNIVTYFILFFIPRIDPRKKNYDLFGSSYQNIRLIIHILFVGIFIYITQAILTGTALNTTAFLAGMFLFFALLGNYLRTVRSNFFVGIRTPWTLSSDVVWRKTHELGGRIWFYTGLAGAVIVLFLPETAGAIFMAATVGVMVLIPVVYSYFEYQKVKEATPDSDGTR